jgi:hypothetical protein
LGVHLEDFAGHSLAAGMTVTSSWAYGEGSLNANGNGSIRFPRGNTVVELDGFSPSAFTAPRGVVRQPVQLRADRRIDLTLPEPVTVVTSVLDGDTDQPVEGVRVTAGGYVYSGWPTDDARADDASLSPDLLPAQLFNARPQGHTDSDGTARFKLFADSTLPLFATESMVGAFRKAAPIVVNADTDSMFNLELPESAQLTIDARSFDGLPIAGVIGEYRITADPFSPSEHGIPFALDANGRPTMKLAPGPARVRLDVPVPSDAATPGAMRLTSVIRLPSDRIVPVRLPQAHELRVLVLDAGGDPVGGAFVVASNTPSLMVGRQSVDARQNARGVTNSNGRAIVTFVEDDHVSVVAYYGQGATAGPIDISGTMDGNVVLRTL